MKQTDSVQKMARAALVAALYVALCLVFAPLSFGAMQVRVSEALALLPVLCPEAVAGVAVGCFLANLLLSAPIDMLVGTLATLVAALLTRRLRHIRHFGLPVLASLPPVLLNAVIIGAELTLLYFEGSGLAGPEVWVANMLSVGAGQVISCCVLGLALVHFIEKRPALMRLLGAEAGPGETP